MMLQICASVLILFATWVAIKIISEARVLMCQKRFIKKAADVRFLYDFMRKYINTEEESYAYVLKMWLEGYKLGSFSNGYEATEKYLELVEDTLQEYDQLGGIMELSSEYYGIIVDLNRMSSDIRYLNWQKNGIKLYLGAAWVLWHL